jgi:hypothetical protein
MTIDVEKILNGLEASNDYIARDTIEDMKEFISVLESALENENVLKQLIHESKRELNKYAISNELCEDCVLTLEPKQYIVNSSEYQGKEVDEYGTKLKCRRCGREY